jgi:DNA-binding NarL/FixJ family response regulator
VRVVIAEDLALLREGIASLLKDGGHEVLAAVGDADGLLEAAAEHPPDLAIVDVRMPPTHTDEGIRAAVELRRRQPEVAILILSQYVEERYATDLLSADSRGVGYLLKDRVADVAEFMAAARRVAAGGTAIDPEGHTNASIAERLVITGGAVEKHVRNVFLKLGLPPTDAQHRRVMAVLTYLGV